MIDNMQEADIGLIGLAVMGQNLVLNLQDHGFRVSVYNRTHSKIDEFLVGPAQGTNIVGAYSIEEFIRTLKKPRRIILMVKAGEPVDEFIHLCLPFLEKGDIIIDGGNSLFTDSSRRCRELKDKGILFIGAGISGGEEGARFGPSIMPGGNKEAWPYIKEFFQKIAAKVDGKPCCEWVGPDGAGHYVKMVHNGIEYGDMQLICEAYALLKDVLNLSPEELQSTFEEWNKGELESYLIEITAKILNKTDDTGRLVLDSILDTAGQKGTGKWAVSNALDLGVPLSLISESVFARYLSSMKEARVEASKVLKGPQTSFKGDKKEFISAIKQALYASKIISYAQGFMLMQQAAKEYHWDLNYGEISMLWRGGCIIRSQFLGKIKEAFEKNHSLKNLLLDSYFLNHIETRQKEWRWVVSTAVELGIPIPCLSAALGFYDSYRSKDLPANLLQAQRDFFGAHTYESKNHPRGIFFHTDWLSSNNDCCD